MKNLNNAKIISNEIFGNVIEKNGEILITKEQFESFSREELINIIRESSFKTITAFTKEEINGFIKIVKENEKKDFAKKMKNKLTKEILIKISEDDCSISGFIENAVDYYLDNGITSIKEINLKRDYNHII